MKPEDSWSKEKTEELICYDDSREEVTNNWKGDRGLPEFVGNGGVFGGVMVEKLSTDSVSK